MASSALKLWVPTTLQGLRYQWLPVDSHSKPVHTRERCAPSGTGRRLRRHLLSFNQLRRGTPTTHCQACVSEVALHWYLGVCVEGGLEGDKEKVCSGTCMQFQCTCCDGRRCYMGTPESSTGVNIVDTCRRACTRSKRQRLCAAASHEHGQGQATSAVASRAGERASRCGRRTGTIDRLKRGFGGWGEGEVLQAGG